MKKRFALLAAAMMCLMMVMPGAALGEAVQVTEAAKAACAAAGGILAETPLSVKVVSPYGTQSVVLRDAPSDSYHPVAMLMVGQEMAVVGTQGEFVYVLLGDGGMGWLAADEVETK